jgi:hypothetical protein
MKKVFDILGGNFEACRQAEEWCDERGIAVGVKQSGQPRGLLLGAYRIAKWRNLRPHEQAELHGTMTGDMRHGPVTITLNGEEDDYPAEADDGGFEGIPR